MSTAYLATGETVELLEKTSLGCIVRRVWEHEDGEPMFGEPEFIKAVLDKPPVAKYDESIAHLDSEIQKRQQRLGEIRTELTDAEAKHATIADKIKRVAKLTRLMDYIDGKITHYVVIRWQGVEIMEFKESLSQEGGYKRKLKLLTLFGDSEGDLEWGLNYYRDGSGGSDTVIPAIGIEDANRIAAEQVLLLAEASKERPNNSVLESAKKFNVKLPAEYQQLLEKNELANLERSAGEHQKALTQIQTRIAELQTK